MGEPGAGVLFWMGNGQGSVRAVWRVAAAARLGYWCGFPIWRALCVSARCCVLRVLLTMRAHSFGAVLVVCSCKNRHSIQHHPLCSGAWSAPTLFILS